MNRSATGSDVAQDARPTTPTEHESRDALATMLHQACAVFEGARIPTVDEVHRLVVGAVHRALPDLCVTITDTAPDGSTRQVAAEGACALHAGQPGDSTPAPFTGEVHGVVSLPLARGKPGRPSVVALHLHSGTPGLLDPVSRAFATLFAEHAAQVLRGARRVADLERALDTRDVIGQAKGVLMQRDGVGPDEAFTRLVEASQIANLKLHAVAGWVVAQVGGADRRGAAPLTASGDDASVDVPATIGVDDSSDSVVSIPTR